MTLKDVYREKVMLLKAVERMITISPVNGYTISWDKFVKLRSIINKQYSKYDKMEINYQEAMKQAKEDYE